MNKRLPLRTFFCLLGLLTSLLAAGVLLVARRRILLHTVAASYTPSPDTAEWEGEWKFSELGADPSEAGAERVAIPFVGTDFALRVRKGDYRGHFFVSVDGNPANRLPQDKRGAYLILTSPDRAPQVVTVPVADGLEDGPHVALVTAERGWGQWPLVGWSVSRTPDVTSYHWASAGLIGLGAVFLIGSLWWAGGQGDKETGRQGDKETRGQGDKETEGQEDKETEGQGDRETGGWREFLISSCIILLASVFYFSPWSPLTLMAGLGLAVFILLRLDLGLALVMATIPFYLRPRPLLGKTFSMAEILTLLCAFSWGAKRIMDWRLHLYRHHHPQEMQKTDLEPSDGKPEGPDDPTNDRGLSFGFPLSRLWNLTSLDLAAAIFTLTALAAILVAERRHVALRELRLVVLEPVLFYLMLRTSRLDGRAIWRLVDFLLLGAVIVALLGLIQYAFSDVGLVRRICGDIITAEGGFRRLRSIYGSPNNAGLYLGRVLPILAAVVLLGVSRARRAAYALAAVPVGLALLLTFSKGALMLGVPLSMLTLGALAGGRWLWLSLGTVFAAAMVALPLLRTPRFASLFDSQSGTLFFRLHLWRSSWAMFCDHPWLGVGLDNFLYQYRGHYIRPAAWQEPNLSHAHNLLLNYATRMGAVGLAAWGWLQIAFWRLALPLRRLSDCSRRALALGLMGSMVNSLAHGLVDASYFLADLAFVFFLILGLAQRLSRNCKQGGLNTDPFSSFA